MFIGKGDVNIKIVFFLNNVLNLCIFNNKMFW